jgi:hypothetical protein
VRELGGRPTPRGSLPVVLNSTEARGGAALVCVWQTEMVPQGVI